MFILNTKSNKYTLLFKTILFNYFIVFIKDDYFWFKSIISKSNCLPHRFTLICNVATYIVFFLFSFPLFLCGYFFLHFRVFHTLSHSLSSTLFLSRSISFSFLPSSTKCDKMPLSSFQCCLDAFRLLAK